MPRKYTPRVSCVCLHCGKDFSLSPGEIRKGSGKFCSLDCRRTYGAERRWVERTCKQCGVTFTVTRYIVNKGLGIFCSNECSQLFRFGTFEERFWNKVNKGAADDCWEWQATRDKRNYGKFGVDGHIRAAHRVVWEMTYGAIPAGLEVCHRCDNPPCVNPAHLFLATHLENMHDRDRNGRYRSGENPKGEAHHAAKLTEERVRQIRAATRSELPRLAAEFGVSMNTVLGVFYRQSWKHVD